MSETTAPLPWQHTSVTMTWLTSGLGRFTSGLGSLLSLDGKLRFAHLFKEYAFTIHFALDVFREEVGSNPIWAWGSSQAAWAGL